MEVYEGLLPSGRGVRVKRLSTREKLAIDDRVEKKTQGKGSSSMSMLETIMTCLVAYTEPRPFVMRTIEDAETKVEEIDVDATLSAFTEDKWRKTGYMELNTSGPLSLVDVFDNYIDFSALMALIGNVSGKGADKVGTLAGKVRARAIPDAS